MKVDYPGSILPFTKVQPGVFFAHFAGGGLGLAMKIQTAASPPAVAVLSFTDHVHPSIPSPVVLDTTQFDNRDVLVLKEATLRPRSDLNALVDGSPPQKDKSSGSLIMTEGSIYIRAVHQRFLVDVNMNTGETKSSTAHPGAMWVDDWEIVLPHAGADIVVCRRDKIATPVSAVARQASA